MNKLSNLAGVSVVILALVLLSPTADAQHRPRAPRLPKGLPGPIASLGKLPGAGLPLPGVRGGLPFPAPSSRSLRPPMGGGLPGLGAPPRGGGLPGFGLPPLGSPPFGGGRSGGPFGGGSGGFPGGLPGAPWGAPPFGLPGLGGPGGGLPFPPFGLPTDPYKIEKERADAYRDAAIVGAVANVVGALITSTLAPPPQTVVVQSAPPVVRTPVPAPVGRYETRRTKVGGGYHERVEVWVPDRVDPNTGSVIEGHYETERRWVPEVWQETQVWVGP